MFPLHCIQLLDLARSWLLGSIKMFQEVIELRQVPPIGRNWSLRRGLRRCSGRIMDKQPAKTSLDVRQPLINALRMELLTYGSPIDCCRTAWKVLWE